MYFLIQWTVGITVLRKKKKKNFDGYFKGMNAIILRSNRLYMYINIGTREIIRNN
jgi:hypothetical protein